MRGLEALGHQLQELLLPWGGLAWFQFGGDFSHVHFRYVEFRRLNLETVKFPESDEHIVIDDFPRVLDGMLAALKQRNDDASKRLYSHLAFKKKWLGPNQKRGVLVKQDIRAASGQEGLDFLFSPCDPRTSMSHYRLQAVSKECGTTTWRKISGVFSAFEFL